MRRCAALTLLAMLAAGCEKPNGFAPPLKAIDQDKRERLFVQCMDLLPAGPESTHYNDWDEVVSECDAAATRQAYYCYRNCPPPPALAAREQTDG